MTEFEEMTKLCKELAIREQSFRFTAYVLIKCKQICIELANNIPDKVGGWKGEFGPLELAIKMDAENCTFTVNLSEPHRKTGFDYRVPIIEMGNINFYVAELLEIGIMKFMQGATAWADKQPKARE